MKKSVVFLWAFMMACSALFAESIPMTSPSGKVNLSFNLQNGKPTYTLSYKGKSVMEESSLGFSIKDMADFGLSYTLTNIEKKSVDEPWTPVWGETKTIQNKYNQLIVTLTDNAKTPHIIKINFKIYDDGVGFRYEFPEQENLMHFIINDELTSFNLTGDHKIWWIPGDFDTNEYAYYTSKITEVEKKTQKRDGNIFTATPIAGSFVQTPLMIKSAEGIYMNIHEAALINYPCMDLKFDVNTFNATTTLAPDAVGNKAYMRAPAQTPWRTIVVSDDAREIIASKMILNLNEPSKIADATYIKPMKYVGIWLEMHLGVSTWDYAGSQSASDAGGEAKKATKVKHGATTENTKKYIDFAAENGFSGVLVEGWNTGWEDWFGKWKEDVFDFVTPYPDFDVKGLNQYARSKNITIITHHETSGSVTNYERWMDTAYRQMNAYGSTALKSGYVGRIIPRGEYHDGQWMVNHYLRAIKKASDYNIMVVAHEPVRPTGLHRTYPNFMAAEAARGQEFNFWSEGNPPEHETILPFTRIMGGPMDYTPGIFKIKKSYYIPGAKEQVHTTLTKQLALYVTLYSPVQMVTDLPENYKAKLDAFQFIKDVAVDWDDTKILLAEPGDYLATARKAKGTNNWFIGAISDENARTMTIDFSFLDKGKKYDITIYKDAQDASWDNNPEAYKIEKMTVTSKTKLTVNVARGGGFAISAFPKK
ncbi:MAG: alpha-glucosidase [Bacteroidetes bacterium B1(2017)]|nr:MAG: alpha-glucosidase [Bacteroidetes bacterium B1(2017)]